MKICTTCKLEKPLNEFYKNNATSDGLCFKCKLCQNAFYKAYNASRRDAKAKVHVQSKVCRQCGLEKPISQFGRKSTSLDKHQIYCKPCWREKTYKAIRKSNGR